MNREDKQRGKVGISLSHSLRNQWKKNLYYYTILRENLKLKMSFLNLILLTAELMYTNQVVNVWKISLRHTLMLGLN